MNYPTRNFIHSFEKRFQELERRLENTHRVGFVAKDGVKYDQEKKRWYVKLQQSDEAGAGDKDPWTSDWLPWESMASGWLKVSSPPYEGQSIQMHSPTGTPELGSCRPYHNNPDTPSPSDKPNQYVMQVELPGKDGKPGSDKNKILNFTYTEDGATVKIGDTTHNLTKDTQSIQTKNNNTTTENDTTKVSDTHKLETKNRTVQATKTVINSQQYGLSGKVVINS
jgi:phage baseplate assembly protein gpV